MRWDGPAPLQSGNAELQGKLYLQTIATFRCKTQTIDSVFIRGGDVGTRPNAPISLTIGAVIRDREGAARIRSARYAAHAVSLLGGTMVRRAYRQRSLVEVLLPDGDKLWDSTLRQSCSTTMSSSIVWRRLWRGVIPRVGAGADWGRPPPSCCGCSSSSISPTGASMSVSERCGGAWFIARSAGSTANASRP